MIINKNPFHIPACQAIACWFYCLPAVHGVAISSVDGCDADFVRRWPGFVNLEKYQQRLSRIAVDRWDALKLDRYFDVLLCPDYGCDYDDYDGYDSDVDDGLMHAGGVM